MYLLNIDEQKVIIMFFKMIYKCVVIEILFFVTEISTIKGNKINYLIGTSAKTLILYCSS